MMKTKLHLMPTMLLLLVSALFVGACSSDDEASPDPVLDDLRARIDASQISFMTDLRSIDGRRVKANQDVAFADDSRGNPDSRVWTFEGGPASSTNEIATVRWTEQVGQVRVILKVTRSADGASDADTLDIQVGPVEMMNRVVYGFENQNSEIDPISKWFYWTPNDGTVSISHEMADGANGTSRSLKLTAADNFGEFQLRPHENGPEFLLTLESEKSYVFSFYMKGSQSFTLSEAAILNVKNDDPREGWYTPFWSGDAAYDDIVLSTNWRKFSYEFTTADIASFGDEGYANGKAENAGPFFKHFGAFSSETSVWIDEMSLKEKEVE